MSMIRIALALALLAGTAGADVTAAARAFSEGQAAQLAGDYERAAQHYELAYSIVPSKEALRSAVRARMLASQLPRAATLAEVLLASYGGDPPSVKLANEVLAEARSKLARVGLKCAAGCTIAVDARAVTLAPAPKHAFYLASGKHSIEVTFEGNLSVSRDIDAQPGVEIDLTIEKPAPKVEPPPPPPPHQDQPPPPPPHQEQLPPPPPPPATRRELPMVIPIAGGATTLVLAGLTTWAGVATWNEHDKYVANPTDAVYNQGRTLQLRTNVLLTSTIAVGVGTALVCLLYRREVPVAAQVDANGGSVAIGWKF
jgi:hypothetical protein